MGILGTWEYLTDLISSRNKKKKKQMNTVSIKIRMDCEGCARKVKNVLSRIKGAKSVEVDLKQQKATVTGYVDQKKVMKAAKKTKKRVEMWPYVPYNLIAHPYVAGVYDKKAPPNNVRKTEEPGVVNLTPLEEQLTLMFNDENTDACSIM